MPWENERYDVKELMARYNFEANCKIENKSVNVLKTFCPLPNDCDNENDPVGILKKFAIFSWDWMIDIDCKTLV